jgi:hypothetical protein
MLAWLSESLVNQAEPFWPPETGQPCFSVWNLGGETRNGACGVRSRSGRVLHTLHCLADAADASQPWRRPRPFLHRANPRKTVRYCRPSATQLCNVVVTDRGELTQKPRSLLADRSRRQTTWPRTADSPVSHGLPSAFGLPQDSDHLPWGDVVARRRPRLAALSYLFEKAQRKM